MKCGMVATLFLGVEAGFLAASTSRAFVELNLASDDATGSRQGKILYNKQRVQSPGKFLFIQEVENAHQTGLQDYNTTLPKWSM